MINNSAKSMFPLFELAKLLNFVNDAHKTEQTVTVRHYAWKEVGERSFLALLFSNGYFLFRHATHGRVPVCRQLPWYPDRMVQGMTFDPSATWLLCISNKEVLYIVPVLHLLDNRVQGSQQWKTDDITKIKYRKKRGLPICVTWWHTLNGEDIAVIGTKLGFVVFVDLRTERVVTDSDVNEQVSNIELLHNDERTVTHALVTTKSNTQWKILLESCECSTAHLGKNPLRDESVEALGFDTIDPKEVNISILHNIETHGSEFQPLKCQQFSTETFVTPLHIKGRNLVAARDLHKKLFEIYDSGMERSPLYVYAIPETVNDVVMTDRLLFFTSTNETSCLEVVATQLSEASTLERRQEFNKEAVLQRFNLTPEERILTIFKRTYPFYWHEKLEQENLPVKTGLESGLGGKRSSSPFRISTHTVLDGLIVLTTQNIYECRPRISPEALFVELAISRSDYSSAETLAIALGLDVNALYYLAAQLHLSHHDYSQAARFFQLAKCPHLQRVGAFAQYGCMSEVLRYLQQTLNSHLHELKGKEGPGLSSMAAIAFIQQLLEDKTRTNELLHQFREFLLTNRMYDSKEAAELLISHGFYELALDMGKARNCMVDILIEVFKTGGCTDNSLSSIAKDVPQEQLQKLLNSSVIHHLSPTDFVHLLHDHRSVALRFLDHFLMVIPDMDVNMVENMTQLFDISHPAYRRIINLSGTNASRSRYQSTSSVDSSSNANPMDCNQTSDNSLKELVEAFTKCVILLNSKRQKSDLQLGFGENGFSPPYYKSDVRPKTTLQYQLEVRQQVLSSSGNSCSMIHGGRLYVWGDTFEEERREVSEEKGALPLWQPYTPQALSSCNVTAVVCGAHHSLAQTNLGVYSWGDNRYGQLGAGTMGGGPFLGPQKVVGLEDIVCVALECGHYHSLLLSDDCRVFTWGWGVHGQLGHGEVIDLPIPKVMEFSLKHRVCDIAAGYGHSVFSTDAGEVYACGSGIFGQLGHGTTNKHSLPNHVSSLKDHVVSVATKDFTCLALTRGGDVYQWGASPNQLCFIVKDQRQARVRGYPIQPTSQLEKHLLPKLVNLACVGAKIIKVACGGTFAVLLTEDGEVFSWGKNYDGQLGIGNRNEQKIPVIVNRINHRKVAAIACGGDHIVVMDTERQMWAWGRNDYGQLAVVTSQGPCPSGGGQGIYVSMGIYAAVWPVKIPSLNKITASPSSKSQPPLQPKLETEGKWVTVLPQLCPYNCDSLFTVLQNLPTECDPALWLQMCLDYSLPVTAGSLALHQGILPLALHCHLKAFTSSLGTNSENLGAIADFYFRKLEEKDEPYEGTHIKDVQQVICQLAEVWNKEGYNEQELTRIISRYLPSMAWAVFLLLMRSTDSHILDETTEEHQVSTKSAEDGLDCSSSSLHLPPSFLSNLCTPFCVEVTSCVVQLVNEDKIPKVQASLLCPLLTPVPELDEERNFIATDKLWDEIFQNLRKDSAASHTEILLSQNDVDSLVATPSKDTGVEHGEEGLETEVVVFSCGHHLSRRVLLEEIVPEFEHELMSMNLPQSSAFLGSHFRTHRTLRTACPPCVLISIRSF